MKILHTVHYYSPGVGGVQGGTTSVTARKCAPFKTLWEQLQALEDLLRLSLVDDTPPEERLYEVWLDGLCKGAHEIV